MDTPWADRRGKGTVVGFRGVQCV